MNTAQIENLLMNLGQQRDDIVVEGLQVQCPLVELFEGDDQLSSTPEIGVEMTFYAESKVFYALNFTLKKTFPEEDTYEGTLPYPFKLSMSQAEMRELLGEPLKSAGPIKLPQPLGLVGGWDLFSLDQSKFPGLKLLLQYTASLEVFGLVFTLLDVEI